MTGLTLAQRGRYLILCPTHAVAALEGPGERVCPHGGHRLARWWVFDQDQRRVLGEASEERGHEREINRPLREVPRLELADVCLTVREKERGAMPRGIKGSGPTAGTKKKGVLEVARFEAGDNLLRIALVAHQTTSELSYRVLWETRARGAKDAERGTAVVCATEDLGRDAFGQRVTAALDAGWIRTVGIGVRLVLKDVPPPPTVAAARKRKAA